MMELDFLPATAQDQNAIFDQCKALIDAYEDKTAIDYSSVLDWVRRKIEKTITDYAKIVQNGNIVGYVSLHPAGGKIELDDFYILPPYRNCGIGTEVLKHCLTNRNCPVFLFVYTRNQGAIRLYQRFGFRKTKEVSPTRWIMEWQSEK